MRRFLLDEPHIIDGRSADPTAHLVPENQDEHDQTETGERTTYDLITLQCREMRYLPSQELMERGLNPTREPGLISLVEQERCQESAAQEEHGNTGSRTLNPGCLSLLLMSLHLRRALMLKRSRPGSRGRN